MYNKNMKSKTLILQSQTTNKAGRAILTLTKQDDLLTTKLRLYSFAPLDAQTKLGIYHNNQVYSSNMLFKDGAYISSLVGDFDMNDDFYCAIVDTSTNNTPLLAGGTYAGFYFNDTNVITSNLNNSFSPNKITPARETAEQKNNLSPARPLEDLNAEFENAFPNHNEEFLPTNNQHNCPSTNQSTSINQPQAEQNCNLCANCKYKAYFYSQQTDTHTNQASANENNPQNNETNVPAQPAESKIPSIIENLIPQFDYIFKTFPDCQELNDRIENSHFVTITEGNSTYCIGAIYKDDQLEYICYAVPTSYNAPVPEELGNHHQWLPLDPEDPLSDGYHIVYQDAHDLKIIEV